jgi:hypothetical protein
MKELCKKDIKIPNRHQIADELLDETYRSYKIKIGEEIIKMKYLNFSSDENLINSNRIHTITVEISKKISYIYKPNL